MKNKPQGPPLAHILFVVCAVDFIAYVLGLYNRPWFPGFLAAQLAIIYFVVLWRRLRLQDFDLLEADVLYLLLFGLYLIIPTIVYAVYLTDGQARSTEVKVICSVGVGLLSLTTGLRARLGSKIAKFESSIDGPWEPKEATRAAWIFIIVGVMLLLTLVSRVGLALYTESRYVESYTAEEGFGFLTVGATILAVGILLLFLARAEPGQRVSWVALGLFLLFSLVEFRAGRRRLVVEPALALLALYHFYVQPLRRRILLVWGTAFICLLILVGQARSYLQEGFWGMLESAKSELSFNTAFQTFMELDSVHLVLSETVNSVPSQQPYRNGVTFLEGFQDLVPLMWNPGRPLAPSQWFVWQYDPVTAAAGGGYGYSLLAEGYLNFGFLGVAIVCYLEGLFLNLMICYRREKPASKGRLLLYGVAFTFLISLLRGDFASLLKGYMVAAGIPALASVLWLGGRGISARS